MLSYGCTRLEIGVQSVYEDVARDTNRSVKERGRIHVHLYVSGYKIRSPYLVIENPISTLSIEHLIFSSQQGVVIHNNDYTSS